MHITGGGPVTSDMEQERNSAVQCLCRVRPIQMLTPLIENKTLTAQTASKVPRLTGSNPASKAPQASRENRECLRVSTRIMPIQKQMAGVTMTISIQNNGVADQSPLKALVA